MFESPWTVVSTLVAYGAWHAMRFMRQVLREPRQEKRPGRRAIADDSTLTAEACRIAEADVRYCMEERAVYGGGTAHILCAGRRNFREPWARDFSFASFGLLALGEKKTVREGLEVFFRFQRPDGQMPVKVRSTRVLERYLHSLFARHQPIRKPLRPKFLTGHRTVSLDGNGLLVIAAANYVVETEDRDFLDRVAEGMRGALSWMHGFAGEDGLLRQGPYTDWADTVGRRGVVLYTNVVYWKALSLTAQVLDSQPLRDRAEAVRSSLLLQLWMEERGHFATSPGLPMLNTDGNALAVAWGLVDGRTAERILDALDPLASPVPTQCTDSPYPKGWVSTENYIAGIPHYHTSAAWMWLGSWHAVAALRTGRRQRALELLRAMDLHVVQDGVVYEVYETNGKPLETLLYKSEAPLTWNAAMLLYAHHEVANAR